MTNPPNFKPGIGRLATDRYDFQSHLEGKNPVGKTGFRHTDDQVDVNPPINSLGLPSNVHEALENIGIFIGNQLGKGEGFITIGDGYDTWAHADAISGIFFDPTVPSLDKILNPIFQSILNNGIGTGPTVSPLSDQFVRIQRGGIVVIKAGTYIVTSPITVPPGIVIIGEGFGTKIINATSLVLSPLPPFPKLVPTTAPVFIIAADGYRTINDTAVSGNLFMFSRKTVISNLVISDNFVENTILGDVFYKIPQNSSGDIPLIQQEQGSNFILDSVYLIGRVNFSSGEIVSRATTFAVQLDQSSPNSNGTFLKINNSFIDGFSIPIDFQSTGGSNDNLEITNNKIKSYGYLTGDNSNPQNNCIIRMNDNNAIVVNNYLYGNSNVVTSAVFINSVIGSAPNYQAESKVIISNNDITIDKSQNVINSSFKILNINSGISNITTRIFSLVIGNLFQGITGFEAYFNGNATPTFSVNSTSATIATGLIVQGSLTLNTNLINSNYTVDASQSDYMIVVNTSSSAITINLPIHVRGRTLIIKDGNGNASVNPITLIRNGGTGNIDDYNGSRMLNVDWGSWTLVSDGTNWLFV